MSIAYVVPQGFCEAETEAQRSQVMFKAPKVMRGRARVEARMDLAGNLSVFHDKQVTRMLNKAASSVFITVKSN